MNFCKLYREHAGERVKIEMTDGEIFTGKLEGYISAMDNDPELESILVDSTELYTDEIKKVNILR